MPKGLSIPVGVNGLGGAACSEGDVNDAKIISLALGSDDSENPFQKGIGIGVGMIFDLDDATSRAAIQARVVRVFNIFEAQRRYKLASNTMKWSGGNGEVILEFKYISMEADDERWYRKAYTPAAAGAR